MKKLLCIALSMLFVTGCATSSQTPVNDNTTEITSTEVSSSSDIDDLSVTYSRDDFALYTPPDSEGNSNFIIGLDADLDSLPFGDNELIRYLDVTTYDVEDKMVQEEANSAPVKETVVNHIRYDGGHLPVVNCKGISTAGLMDDSKEYCSTAEDVKVAYDINRKKEEEYITNKRDDKNYVIQLYFTKKEVPQEQTEIVTNEKGQRVQKMIYKYERVIVDKGKDLLDVPEATYSMKFLIEDGFVKTIDLYSYR